MDRQLDRSTDAEVDGWMDKWTDRLVDYVLSVSHKNRLGNVFVHYLILAQTHPMSMINYSSGSPKQFICNLNCHHTFLAGSLIARDNEMCK